MNIARQQIYPIVYLSLGVTRVGHLRSQTDRSHNHAGSSARKEAISSTLLLSLPSSSSRRRPRRPLHRSVFPRRNLRSLFSRIVLVARVLLSLATSETCDSLRRASRRVALRSPLSTLTPSVFVARSGSRVYVHLPCYRTLHE